MFMQEIHANQKKEYIKNKSLTLSQRLKLIQKESNKVLHKV